jgi:hypothetical protein
LIVTTRQVFNFGDQNASSIVTRFAVTGVGRTEASDANDDVTTAEHTRKAESEHLTRSANLITLFLEENINGD